MFNIRRGDLQKPMNSSKKSSPMKVPLSGLEDLHNITKSKTPLAGRKIMIPMTTKAFFEGSLEPTLRNSKDDKPGEEQLMVNLGQGYLAEMTKDEASDYIERRMKALRPLAKQAVEKKSGILKMKKGFLQSQKKTAKKRTSSKKNTTPSRTSKPPVEPLPFIEIKEEFDKDGNEIKAEAMNMSRQLHNIRQEIQSKKDGNQGKHEILDTLLDSVPQLTDGDDSEVIMSEDDETSTIGHEEAVEESRRPYAEISSRLDQLILLEEEDEKKKASNVKSSKRLQGKGWSKGFLSNGAKGSKNKSDKKKSKIIEQNAVPGSSNAKKVQFQKSPKVKEIPRIGTRSIESSRNTAQRAQEPSSSLEQTILGGSKQNSTRPSKSISVGNVIEQNSNANATKLPQNQEAEPKKKLSKFAQRRQQQRF